MAQVLNYPLPREHGTEKPIESLVGSGKQPSSWPTNDGGLLQLGDVVRLAWKLSQLSVEQWNTLPEDIREGKIVAALAHYKNEIKGE